MNNEVLDKAETLILAALDGKCNIDKSEERTGMAHVIDGMRFITTVQDQGMLLGFKNEYPSCAYTFDACDGNRIIGGHPDYLISSPQEILGDRSEILHIKNISGIEYVSWMCFKRTAKPKKTRELCCLGSPSDWYEMHIRNIFLNGKDTYYKRIIPLNKGGFPLLAKLQGHFVCDPKEEGLTILLSASIIEDAHRSNAMLVSVKDAVDLRFPVPVNDYKEVFAFRDGPMAGSRRKAIVHWVMKHLRKSTRGNVHDVKRHIRGVTEITVDGLTIRISPNEWPHKWVASNQHG